MITLEGIAESLLEVRGWALDFVSVCFYLRTFWNQLRVSRLQKVGRHLSLDLWHVKTLNLIVKNRLRRYLSPMLELWRRFLLRLRYRPRPPRVLWLWWLRLVWTGGQLRHIRPINTVLIDVLLDEDLVLLGDIAELEVQELEVIRLASI